MNLYIPVLIASTFTINGHDNDQNSDSGFGDFELNAQFWNISMIFLFKQFGVYNFWILRMDLGSFYKPKLYHSNIMLSFSWVLSCVPNPSSDVIRECVPYSWIISASVLKIWMKITQNFQQNFKFSYRFLMFPSSFQSNYLDKLFVTLLLPRHTVYKIWCTASYPTSHDDAVLKLFLWENMQEARLIQFSQYRELPQFLHLHERMNVFTK